MSGSSERLKAYSLLRRIGKGSYGEVYLVAVEDGKKQVQGRGIHHLTYLPYSNFLLVCDEEYPTD